MNVICVYETIIPAFETEAGEQRSPLQKTIIVINPTIIIDALYRRGGVRPPFFRFNAQRRGGLTPPLQNIFHCPY
jgi:hypothetical protein